MKLLVIIPAYNEEKCIATVVDRLTNSFPQYDYVIVNDGSRDETARICKEKEYHLIDQPINLGLAGAFQTGMKYAWENEYDAAIQFDADGQHLPEYIQPMLECLKEGNDIVIGSRFVNKKKPFTLRMIGSHMISFAIRCTTGKRIADPTSGMRLYNRRMIKELASQINYGPEPDTIAYLLRRGARVAEVPVVMEERIAGSSYLTLFRSLTYMLQMFFSILCVQWVRRGEPFAKNESREADHCVG